MKLKEVKIIRGKIKLKTGLHIGGNADTIEIGGIDNPVIRNHLTNEPYIPGSSIKGKMRALLEWKLGKIKPDGKPHEWCHDKNCPICRIFGTSDSEAEIGPSRLIVRDAELSEEWKARIHKEGIILSEIKMENTINRITARANPRKMERIPPSVEFEFEMVYHIFDMGDDGKTDEDLFKYVKEGLQLLQNDYLGGSGSRGYGKIEFLDLKVNGEPLKLSQ